MTLKLKILVNRKQEGKIKFVYENVNLFYPKSNNVEVEIVDHENLFSKFKFVGIKMQFRV